jgi:hypothetical protein
MCINHALGTRTVQLPDLSDPRPTDRKVSGGPGISRTINDPSILDDEVVVATIFLINPRLRSG